MTALHVGRESKPKTIIFQCWNWSLLVEDVALPVRTTPRECFIAMTAAMKNVLSPNSDTRIMISEEKKASICVELSKHASWQNIECACSSNPSRTLSDTRTMISKKKKTSY